MELNTNFVDPPIICVLGERGDGKSLFLTALGKLYSEVDNLKVFANYHIKGYNYTYMTFEDVAKFPEEVKDAVVLLDEMHIGADAYEVFKSRVKNITTFSTQLRKRNVTMLYTTQRFKTVAKRLRDMTNYVIEVNKTEQKGVIFCQVFDRGYTDGGDNFIKEFVLDGRQFFNMYDTKELILE